MGRAPFPVQQQGMRDMNKMILALGAVSMLSLGACANDGYGSRGPGYYSQAPAGSYDAYHHYRSGSQYHRRHLTRNDTIYRGSDGRYYCKRNDGTTGLVIGGIAGGLLGNAVAGGTLGTLVGAGGGALLGRSIDRGNVKCR